MRIQALHLQSELSKRVATGVAGGAALLCIILYGGWLGIFFLTALLSMAMVYEYTKIVYSLPDGIEKRYLMLCLTWFVDLSNLLTTKSEYEVLLVVFFGLFLYFLFTASRYDHDLLPIHFKEMVYSVFGILYLVFLPLYFMRIHESAFGATWTVLFLLIVWSNDTAAYFVGKKYGRKKLYPRISPKKTWEGSIGGLAGGLGITFVFKLLFFGEMPWAAVPVIPIAVGAMSQVGDLCESYFKRTFDVKDSGSILPGHGGMLDRFDGVLFGLPVMYACMRILT